MNMKFHVAVFLIAASMDAFAGGRSRPTPEPVASPSPIASASPIPITNVQGITFKPVDYYTTEAEREKIKRVGALVNRVFQSQCFADFMGKRKLIQTGGRTPPQVAEFIQSLTGVVPVEMYSRCMRFNVFKCPAPTSAVAYRNPGSPTIHLNRAAFWTNQPDCTWAKTQAHESLHSYGFDHDFEWSPSRSYSVPYSVGGGDAAQGGDAFEKCCH